MRTIETNERIKYLRKNILKLTQEVFAEKIMLKRNSLALIETGRNSLTDRTISDICREFNVNEEWLRFGTGEIFTPQPTDELDALSRKYKLDESERSILSEFLQMSTEEKKIMLHFVESLKKTRLDNDVSEELASNYSKLSEESKKDVVSYSETLLLNEKFERNNETGAKKSKNTVHKDNTRRNQA